MPGKLFLPVLLVVFFTACKSKTAFNYSEDFVSKERSLTPEIEKGEAQVKDFYADKKFDSIAMVGARLEKLVDVQLKKIEEEPAPDVKEANNFKIAGIHYFEFMKSIYTKYKAFGSAATPEERDKIFNEITEIANKKPAVLADIQMAQKKYAEANNFKVK